MGQVTQRLQIQAGEWVCAGCGQPITAAAAEAEHYDPRGVGPQGVPVTVEGAVIAHADTCSEVTAIVKAVTGE